MNPITAVAGPVVKAIMEKVGAYIEAPLKRAELEAEVTVKVVDGLLTLTGQQRDIIVAEAQGASWLQRNWRPVLMLSIVAIVVNNYLLGPYFNLLFGVSVVLELPERMWDLMTIGVGGYVGGRSIEKTVETWAASQKGRK